MTARIVFDLDGTLIDSAKDIQAIANASLALVDAAPLSLEESQSFVGNGIGVFVEKMRMSRDIPITEHERLLAEMTARYEHAVALTELYPNVAQTLLMLSKDNRLGICTNKLHKPCLAVLEHLKIRSFFESIWGGDNPLGRKPDPAPLLAVFEELGDGPCLYVGDSEVDAEAAVRAEVPFILFTSGYRKSPVEDIPHTVQFDDFAALPDIISRLNL